MTQPLVLVPPPLGSDGHCTGFPDGIGPWDWHECCLVHDAGGSDGALVDCITQVVPPWGEAIVLIAVATMVIWRPVYNIGQRHHWWK